MNLKYTAVLVASLAAFFAFGANPFAQSKTQFPTRAGHLNDFASVVDEQTKQRLEIVLENLQRRSGVQIDIATIQNTGGRDIFELSRQLSQEWNVGAPDTKARSLLLVIAVEEKTSFTQFSRSVQALLPEGILGDIAQRLRNFLASGNYGGGLDDGVQLLVTTLAGKVGFSLEGIDQRPPIAAAVTSPAVPDSSPIPKTSDLPAPTVTEVASTKEVTRPRTTKTHPSAQATPTPEKQVNPTEDEDEAEEVELTLTLPVEERVVKLKEFLASVPNSKARPRALELLAGAYVALGEKRLKTGDTSGGVELLTLAVETAPSDISEEVFSGAISRIPFNLYSRGERALAVKEAQSIEAKFANSAPRLLAIAGFYLAIEQGEEAAQLAGQAVKMAPEMAEAHQVLASSLHISLRLEAAATEYKRALELNPNSKGTRRSLADLTRATGKAQEALVLYREQLAADPADKAARAGLVLSLLDAGQIEEGNQELDAELQREPRNLTLLAGAAYWFAAHKEPVRALEMARKAVEVEPRYPWSQIALARTLLVQKRPLDAERAIRFARQYGKFPTLDYELASVLSAAGLYEEAAGLLKESFNLQAGQIETRLAGRVPALSDNFTSLLALERRASVFQFTAADDPNNARILKTLLGFSLALSPRGDGAKIDEASVAAAAKEFAAGDDEMRAYRQLYAASRLLRNNVALETAYQLTESAKSGINDALTISAVTVAVQAEEYYPIRAKAIASGSTPDVPQAPRSALANILRGRIEDLAGWILFNQDKANEAVVRLKLAVSVLLEGTPLWRNALWHLGAALEQTSNHDEALSYYIKSYNSGDRDPVRRSIIEQLYRKVNGSLAGLDERIGVADVAANGSTTSVSASGANVASETGATKVVGETQTPAASPDPSMTPVSMESPSARPDSTPASEPPIAPSTGRDTTAKPESIPAVTVPTPSASPASSPEATPASSPEATPISSPEATPVSSPEATPASSPEATPISSPEATPVSSPEATPVSSPEATPVSSPEATPVSSPEATPASSPEATPISSPEATPTSSPEATPVSSPEATPASSPEATPVSSPEATPAETPASPEPPAQPTPKQTPATSEPSLADLPRKLPSAIKVIGRVKDPGNNGIPNVVMVLISPRGTVLASTTDADGNYSFVVAPTQRGYRLIPSRDGYIFEPVDRLLPSLIEDQRGVDFVGTVKSNNDK